MTLLRVKCSGFSAICIAFSLIFITGIKSEEYSLKDTSDGLLDTNLNKCESLNTDVLELCKDIAYNETRFPNFMKQKTQQEAAAETSLFLPLIRINCSPVLKLFLCSLYAPPCVKNYQTTLKPCKEMCLKARNGCESFMKRFSFSWPEYIDCDNFPSFNGAEACITDENYSFQSENQQKSTSSASSNSNLLSNLTPQLLNSIASSNNLNLVSSLLQNPNLKSNDYQIYAAIAAAAAAAAAASSNSASTRANSIIIVKFICPPLLQTSTDTKNTFYLNVNDENIQNCAMPCGNTLFEHSEIEFSRTWIFIWSTLCFISTLLTILTFLIETSRFKYPEKPIIFLSLCYFIVALAYIIGSTTNSNVNICTTLKNGNNQLKDFLIQGVDHVSCTILFMMTYFFGMSSSIWWVVLTLTWYLAAGKKWGHEAIENISSYFHFAAWAIPGFLMIVILWCQRVDADVLSGVCYTGIRNMNYMTGFVLVPLILFLILGTIFLLAGFVSLFRIRNVMRDEGNKTDKLERFMFRIGVFSVLYMAPAIILISCYFYEQSSYSKWMDFWLKKNKNEFNLPPDYVAMSLFENERSTLLFPLFMTKYAMLLIVGITSGFWIWSHKTFSSWKRFINKIFECFKGFKSVYKNEAAV